MKNYKSFLKLFFVVLVAGTLIVGGIYMLFAKRPTESESEKRKLTEKPEISFTSLLSGKYFSDLQAYYDDTVPGREDYKEIMDKIHALYEKYPNLREFIEDEKPTSFNIEETDAFSEWLGLNESLKIIELLEAFKLGGKEAYIFFEEQGMLNI